MKAPLACIRRNFLVVILLSLSGCATILHGTTQKIPVTSDPEGAEVTVGTFRGRTPTVVELERGESHVVRISLERYRTEVIVVGKIITPASSGTNQLESLQKGRDAGQAWRRAAGGSGEPGASVGVLAGLGGLAVDAESGALYRLHPERIQVVLEPGQPSEVNDSRLKDIELLRSQGVLSEEEAAILRRRLLEGQK